MKQGRSFALAATILLPLAVLSAETEAPPDTLMQALDAELARSAGLKLPDVERPYFVSYAIDDTDARWIEASFGALLRDTRDRSRNLRVDVRLGGYDLDSSDFIGTRLAYGGPFFVRPRFLALDDDAMALRHEIWLTTDEAYKSAAEQLAQKKGVLENRADLERLPDFSHEKPVVSIGPRKSVELDSGWVEKVKRLSALFREFPKIQESAVMLHTVGAQKYLASTEGTRVRQPLARVSLMVRASVQAADGEVVRQAITFHEIDPARLPSVERLTKEVRAFAGEMSAITSAPVLDKYLGPVLLAGTASADFFGDFLGPRLSGRRPPLMAQTTMPNPVMESELSSRISRPVLPDFLDVVDDPTVERWNGEALMGAYAVDDEGVAAQKVTLVEKGVLRTLVMGRKPRKGISQSNGHARAGIFAPPQPHIGNLFVKAARGLDEKELKAELLRRTKAQNLPFGLLIRSLSNAPPTEALVYGAPPRSRVSISPPVLAYKVFPDGREELVRGLVFGETSAKSLRDIVAAGKEARVSSGSILPNTPISSIIAPSVLFDELELKADTGSQPKPALLSNPYFEKGAGK